MRYVWEAVKFVGTVIMFLLSFALKIVLIIVSVFMFLFELCARIAGI